MGRIRVENHLARKSAHVRQLELGLYAQSPNRLAAMKTLSISRDFSRFQFIVILVDYNPNSSRFSLDKLARLPFAQQVKVFHVGLAMWQQNVKSVAAHRQ